MKSISSFKIRESLKTRTFVFLKQRTQRISVVHKADGRFLEIPIILFIILLGGVFFIPFLGITHLFDWDEINFAEAAREMILTKNYLTIQIDFTAFWEKPPFFIWLQVISMKLFGINEFAARLPNAITGILTLPILFCIGRKISGSRFGIIWVLAYAGSLLPHLYFKSGIIDPVFNLFIFSSVYFLMAYFSENHIKDVFFAGILAGLAILTKGPAAIVIISLSWFGFWVITSFFISDNRKRNHLTEIVRHVLIFLLFVSVALVVSSFWYGIDAFRNGTEFLSDFFSYQWRLLTTKEAGHSGPFYYHFIVLLVGCFPATMFLFNKSIYVYSSNDNLSKQLYKIWMIMLLTAVLIIFSIVKTKIIHYSSLAYFPITFLCAYFLDSVLAGKIILKKHNLILLGIGGTMIGISMALLPVIGKNTELIIPHIDDKFMTGNLQAFVQWSYIESFIGIVYLVSIILTLVLFTGKHYFRGILMLFFSTAVLIMISTRSFGPKIERYSQGVVIDFYKSIKDEDCYVEVLGYKSYAHLFYSERRPLPYNSERENAGKLSWLLTGSIDKPAYIVCKNIHAGRYRGKYGLIELLEKNGFVFFRREPVMKGI